MDGRIGGQLRSATAPLTAERPVQLDGTEFGIRGIFAIWRSQE